MATSLNLVSVVKPKGTAVATKPFHIGFISQIRSGLFASLHAHATHAMEKESATSNSFAVMNDPVLAHIIADLEHMIEKKFAAYEATQKAHLAAQPVPEHVTSNIVCCDCQKGVGILSHSVDLSEAKTHPNTPEEEHSPVVHSLPMEMEKH